MAPQPGIKPVLLALEGRLLTTGQPEKSLKFWHGNYSVSSNGSLWKYVSRSVTSDSLPLHGLQPARLLCLWNSSGKNTGMGSHFLLHRIFPTQDGTQVSNPGFLHCRHILCHLSHPMGPSCFRLFLLGLNVCFPLQVREVFSCYFFKYVFKYVLCSLSRHPYLLDVWETWILSLLLRLQAK